MSDSVRILVVDDSPFVCRFLTSQLQTAPGFEVIGMALTGARAIELTRELRPDVVTLALQMPDMSGLDVLERIMQECPTPVIVVSGVTHGAADVTLKAFDLGAIDFIFKYSRALDTRPEDLFQELIGKVRSAAKVKVVRSIRSRKPAADSEHRVAAELRPEAPSVEARPPRNGTEGVVVIGASTGGPLAIRELLSGLSPQLPVSLLIVQHMPGSFTRVLAEQLSRHSPFPVREAKQSDRLEQGTVLVAPGDFHTLIEEDSKIKLIGAKEARTHCPSIDVTMQSVARIYGARASGVLLTGMGEDGVEGLVAIREKGGRTFVQDAPSCVVNGMPQRAVDRGIADHVAPPAELARLLTEHHSKGSRR